MCGSSDFMTYVCENVIFVVLVMSPRAIGACKIIKLGYFFLHRLMLILYCLPNHYAFSVHSLD